MFGRKNKEILENVPAMEVARKFVKPTKKKKNTYVVKLGGLMGNISLFDMCDSAPIPVIKKNGVEQQDNVSGWLRATRFPNPSACIMAREYNGLKPVFGQTAETIVEYLDKYTGAPVIQVYPTTVCVLDPYTPENYKLHLNHASRQDLERQLKKREMLYQQFEKSQGR